MASLRQRYNKWEARVRVPRALKQRYGGMEILHRTLAATSRRGAQAEAAVWEAGLKAEWLQQVDGAPEALSALREVYNRNFGPAVAGVYGEMEDPFDESYDNHTAAIEFELGDICH